MTATVWGLITKLMAVTERFSFPAYVPTLCAFVDSEDGQRWRPRSPPWGDKAPDRSSTTERVAGHNWGTNSERGCMSYLHDVSHYRNTPFFTPVSTHEAVPVLVLSAGVSSLLSPLTPGTDPGGTSEGPAGATALGGRFPGTLTVTRRRSISFPWIFCV